MSTQYITDIATCFTISSEKPCYDYDMVVTTQPCVIKQLGCSVVTVMQREWGGAPAPLALTPGPLLFLISTLRFASAGFLSQSE